MWDQMNLGFWAIAFWANSTGLFTVLVRRIPVGGLTKQYHIARGIGEDLCHLGLSVGAFSLRQRAKEHDPVRAAMFSGSFATSSS